MRNVQIKMENFGAPLNIVCVCLCVLVLTRKKKYSLKLMGYFFYYCATVCYGSNILMESHKIFPTNLGQRKGWEARSSGK